MRVRRSVGGDGERSASAILAKRKRSIGWEAQESGIPSGSGTAGSAIGWKDQRVALVSAERTRPSGHLAPSAIQRRGMLTSSSERGSPLTGIRGRSPSASGVTRVMSSLESGSPGAT